MKRVMITAAVAAVAVALSAPRFTHTVNARDALTVHEWGTFTTVAGPDGRAIDWFPLGGPSDLPCFVQRFRNEPDPTPVRAPLSIQGKVAGVVITRVTPGGPATVAPPAAAAGPFTPPPITFDYETTRANVRARVRMETPVIYFYAPGEVVANVRVDFPRGLMTEWYPSADVRQGNVATATLADPNRMGTIEWNGIVIKPDADAPFLGGSGPSHYFAARATDAAPVLHNGEIEKFLFYRGVANFDPPIAATLARGGDVRVENIGPDAIPAMVIFEKRGDRLGFRFHSTPLKAGAGVTLRAPDLKGDFADLRTGLEKLLVQAGLYPKEASSMLDTWVDSWFEEGTRVLYLFSPPAVDRILPLTVSPAPAEVARVFVGRMELVTPVLREMVAQAVERGDYESLMPVARFFGPISDRILEGNRSVERAARYREFANTLLGNYVRLVTTCD